MSQRFIRCGHCGIPHDGEQVFCPTTGKAIRTKRRLPHERGVAAAAKAPARAIVPAPASSRRAAPMRLIGQTIGGKYVVRSILGEGGMGTVFEAEHLALGRFVAVKILHATQATKRDAVRRFQQEARAAAAIGHPNICNVIDLGSLNDGSPYIVMEKLVGETLADRIASEGGLPFEDVIDILVQVLSGLVAAHEQHIVHRDIKPENVFLTTRVGCMPLVKLLDFGVSKIAGPDPKLAGASIPPKPPSGELNLTRTGMVMGTPYYMAPEQARGERDLDARVDLYACGVMLYEALTGKRPFTALNYNALLMQVLSSTPRPACELRPALPPAFGVVIEKAMARQREDRYSAAAEFQRDLQTLRDRYSSPMSAAMVAHEPTTPSQSRLRARGPEGPAVQSNPLIPQVPSVRPAPYAPSAPPLDRETDVDLRADPTEVYDRPSETTSPSIETEDVDLDEEGDEPTQLMSSRRPLQS
jgi:serine/threonine protein kinase